MKRVLICRHGQDEDNVEGLLNGHRDRPLTELGRSQAAAAAELVAARHKDIDVICASPLQRANVTAHTIGAQLGVKVETVDGLIERDFGVLSGKPLSEIPEHATMFHATEKVNYFLDGEGVESFDRCYERAQRVLQHLDAAHNGKVVLLVCHGDIGKMLLGVRRGISWKAALDTPYIANTDVIEL